ncbi:hypothetical protein H1C71_018485 [Ictidomys tridecemlineatus]|nr:hypothetical protein H1C71_018485 [Ictidomys tridecemlineatus]
MLSPPDTGSRWTQTGKTGGWSSMKLTLNPTELNFHHHQKGPGTRLLHALVTLGGSGHLGERRASPGEPLIGLLLLGQKRTRGLRCRGCLSAFFRNSILSTLLRGKKKEREHLFPGGPFL